MTFLKMMFYSFSVSEYSATKNHLTVENDCLFLLCSVGGDDFLVVHTHDDFAAIHGTTPYTHSSLGTPINMPWLGGMQTGRGASVVSSRTEFALCVV